MMVPARVCGGDGGDEPGEEDDDDDDDDNDHESSFACKRWSICLAHIYGAYL